MKIRDRFFRVDSASTLELTSDVDLISINTTDAVILKLPIDLPKGKQIKIKSLVLTPSVTVFSWNNITLLSPTNEITIIEFTNQYVFTEIEEGGGVVTEFIYEDANSYQIGLAQANNISIESSDKPLTRVSRFLASHNGGCQIASDFNLQIYIPSLTSVENGAFLKLIDNITGECEWVNDSVKSKKITGIDCETWSAGVEIEPTKAGVIFMPMTAFLVAEDNHTDNILASINKNVGLINAFNLVLPTSLNTGVNANFRQIDYSIDIFGNDLYLFGTNFVNPGTVTLYVTYQEIIL